MKIKKLKFELFKESINFGYINNRMTEFEAKKRQKKDLENHPNGRITIVPTDRYKCWVLLDEKNGFYAGRVLLPKNHPDNKWFAPIHSKCFNTLFAWKNLTLGFTTGGMAGVFNNGCVGFNCIDDVRYPRKWKEYELFMGVIFLVERLMCSEILAEELRTKMLQETLKTKELQAEALQEEKPFYDPNNIFTYLEVCY